MAYNQCLYICLLVSALCSPFLALQTTFIDNPYFNDSAPDTLFHFGMNTANTDFPAKFGDVKYVLFATSANQILAAANYLYQQLNVGGPAPVNLITTDNFVMYKVGPVLCVNHALGAPSLSALMHGLFKLLRHANASPDVLFFRIGTSGGIDIPAGTIIITENVYNGILESKFDQQANAKIVKYDMPLDAALGNELFDLANSLNLEVVKANTMGTDDFYEGQGRLDGAFCSYTESDKFQFFQKLVQKNIRNIDMVAHAFAALSMRGRVRAAFCCVTNINRSEGDQITAPPSVISEWQSRPIRLVTEYIKRQLQQN